MPWVASVGAGTTGRSIQGSFSLSGAPAGSPWTGTMSPAGASPPAGAPLFQNTTTPDARLCKTGSLAPGAAAGAIVLCARGVYFLEDKVAEAARAGAVGVLLYNTATSKKNTLTVPVRGCLHGGAARRGTRRAAQQDARVAHPRPAAPATAPAPTLAAATAGAHSCLEGAQPAFSPWAPQTGIPALHVDEASGAAILAAVAAAPAALGTLSGPVIAPAEAPAVGDFSGRGPSPTDGSYVLKPDVLAPGVGVFAAVPPGTADAPWPNTTGIFGSGSSAACELRRTGRGGVGCRRRTLACRGPLLQSG
jgi:hypothetical protein